MRAVGIAFVSLLFAACAEPKVPDLHRVRVRVTADDERPVSGARVSISGDRALGDTGLDGTLLIELQALEGTRLPIDVACPDGYLQAAPTSLSLRRHERLDSRSDDATEASVICPRAQRMAAVIIRAGGQAGLPVKLLGREVTKTDSMGIAHTLLSLPPGATFRLTLDTSSDPSLRPKSPTVTFVVPDKDDTLLFDQPFERIAPPPKRRRRPPPPPAPPERPFQIL